MKKESAYGCHISSRATLAGIALAFAACADHPQSSATEVDSTDNVGDAGTSAPPSEPHAAGSSPCPTSLAVVGSACPCAYSCEVGADPDVRCNTLLTGSHGQWTVSQEPADSGCALSSAASCGEAFADVSDGQACVVEGAACFYPEARCVCASACDVGNNGAGNIASGLAWCCSDATNRADGCPTLRPRIGASCGVRSQACDYGACSGNVNLECSGGIWEDVPLECPSPPLEAQRISP